MKDRLNAMEHERSFGIVGERDNRFHTQKLLSVGRPEEVDTHLDRHRINGLIMNDRKGADILSVAVHVVMMVVVRVMTTVIVMRLIMKVVMSMAGSLGLVPQPAIDIRDLGRRIVKPVLQNAYVGRLRTIAIPPLRTRVERVQ